MAFRTFLALECRYRFLDVGYFLLSVLTSTMIVESLALIKFLITNFALESALVFFIFILGPFDPNIYPMHHSHVLVEILFVLECIAALRALKIILMSLWIKYSFEDFSISLGIFFIVCSSNLIRPLNEVGIWIVPLIDVRFVLTKKATEAARWPSFSELIFCSIFQFL